MPRFRFIEPATVRLELTDGDWVEIKSQITYAEQQRLSSAMMRSVKSSDDELGIDWGRYSVLRLETWIVDWSFRDKSDKPVRVHRASIGSLDPETASEIDQAISKHLESLDAQKKELAMANGTG